jgi:hypothetical protein
MLLKRGCVSVGPSFFFGSDPATLHVNDRPELRCEKPVATHAYLTQIRRKSSSDRKDYSAAFLSPGYVLLWIFSFTID